MDGKHTYVMEGKKPSLPPSLLPPLAIPPLWATFLPTMDPLSANLFVYSNRCDVQGGVSRGAVG
jgi:hypothetical protein